MAKAKKLPSGNWRIRISIGKDENGKYVYKSFTAETKKEAEYIASEYLVKHKEKPNNMTVGEAIDRYISSKENILSPTSIASYREIRRNRLQSLMCIPLKDLSQVAVQRAVNLEAKTKSPKTVISAHGLLSSALGMFYPDFVLRTTLPKRQNQIKEILEPSEIIEVVKGTEIEIPVLLALWLGLRMSEIRGIKYSSIKDGYLTINNVIVTVDGKPVEKSSTKTVGSTRILKLPQVLLNLIENQQRTSDSEYVTTLSGQAIYKRFSRLLKRSGLPHMRFHDLRHLNASVMLKLGIQDKYAMERGGWTTTSTLKNVYQHTFSSEREKADALVDDYFLGIYDK